MFGLASERRVDAKVSKAEDRLQEQIEGIQNTLDSLMESIYSVEEQDRIFKSYSFTKGLRFTHDSSSLKKRIFMLEESERVRRKNEFLEARERQDAEHAEYGAHLRDNAMRPEYV